MKFVLYKVFGIAAVFLFNAVYGQSNWHPEKDKKYIILSEQSKSRVAIADIAASKIVWEWCPATQPDIKPEHVVWFNAMSDAKPLDNGKLILACASGGGVALVRVADKQTIFYSYAGGNTHSIAMLPDGNIASASSTGNLLSIFVVSGKTDPEKTIRKDVYLRDGHNLVWDEKQQLLYTASWDQLKTYQYNFNKSAPELRVMDSVPLPDNGAHDLYRVYRKNDLWLSTHSAIFTINLKSRAVTKTTTAFGENIKSVSSGPKGYPTIIIQPKEKWWTDEVLDLKGNMIFCQKGLKIYKARWLL